MNIKIEEEGFRKFIALLDKAEVDCEELSDSVYVRSAIVKYKEILGYTDHHSSKRFKQLRLPYEKEN